MNVQVHQMVQNSPLGKILGDDRMIPNRQIAVDKFLAMGF